MSPEGDSDGITIRFRRSHLWGALGLVVGLVAGFAVARMTEGEPQAVLYGLPGDTAASTATGQPPGTTPVAGDAEIDTGGRPAFGPEDAAVEVIEFVDFQCPFCGSYARETLPKIEREYGEEIRYVSMHLPLPIHEHAVIAARAAECAFAQARYWEFHERLFADQEQLGRSDLLDHAAHLGLDETAFEACLEADETREQVDADAAVAAELAVASTPTFFVAGEPIVGAQPFAAFKSAIDEALADAE